MQYLELRGALKNFTVFSLADIKRIDSYFDKRRLSEWQDKGYIKKVIRGYYIFSDLQLNENVLFEVANRIYSPSYISCEMALSYYHLIPESVYGITSVSTRRTYNFTTPIAEFAYRTVKPGFFFGYNLIRYDNKCFRMASIEKAILDYFYLHSKIKTREDFASLRINRDMFFKQIDEEKLYKFLVRSAQKRLTKRIKSFLEFIKNV